ncbi:septum formation initiator family protein [Persicitalea sp.]|uniref:FtsB family cell division protein n=1 Tax=Persicitalea sp. TaxID=3100273 RepID=UPI0035933896
MAQLPTWLSRLLVHLRKFYTGTLVAWLVWIIFIDDNNLFVLLENRQKMKELERDLGYYKEQVKLVKKEHKEVFGSNAMLEKWAREKYLMRKPTEDVYVIVDENGQSIEKEE